MKRIREYASYLVTNISNLKTREINILVIL